MPEPLAVAAPRAPAPIQPAKYCPTDSRLSLSNLTLYACCWSDADDLLERTAQVLRHCQKLFIFRDTIYFCHRKPKTPLDARLIQIPPLADISQWNIFVSTIIPEFLKGDFAMSVHEDGFPIHPELWDNRFLDYDYIGAPWHDGTVGNGGFNIESQRLIQLKAKLPFCPIPPRPSDYWVCRDNRAFLEQQGIRFAPTDLALKFSTETVGQDKPSFGFHGRKTAEAKYRQGWDQIKYLGSPRMAGKICIVTSIDRNYLPAAKTLFKSIKHYTDCTGIDFKVITADPEVINQFGAENCHIVTDEIKARYSNVKYSKDLPRERYSHSWYRYETFNIKGYDRVICIDSDCLCVEDISYLFSEDLNQYDFASVEDHIVSKLWPPDFAALEAQGLNFRNLHKRIQEGKVDVQPALIVANKAILNDAWYQRLLNYANTTEFTYAIDEGILNDFIYSDNLKIKLLPLEWDYQDLYGVLCPMLPAPSKPIIVHCQQSKPFKNNKAQIDGRLHKWHDKWWQECRFEKPTTIVAIIIWNRFANLQRWIRCWKQCDRKDASLVVVHNLETDNSRYEKLCRENNIKYVPRKNFGFDMGAFQDVCKERLDGFPNDWDNLIWITDDCIPMQKDFVAKYLAKLQEGYLPCYEISDEVKRHVRTTGFMVTKDLSRKLIFPRDPMVDREDCYTFEHKGFNLFEQIQSMGMRPCMVSPVLKDSPLWDTGCRDFLKLMLQHEQEFPILNIPLASAPRESRRPIGELDDLAIKHKSDKSSLFNNFAIKYDAIFAKHRDSFTNIFEIGVAHGKSMRMWVDYFPNATIHGADNSIGTNVCESYSHRIKFHLLDQGNAAQLKNMEQFGPFDLIIDDGNHFWREQILSFETLFPFVKPGGIYIVEDSCTSYWEGYKNCAISCVDYFKKLVDAVNFNGAPGKLPSDPSRDFVDEMWKHGWQRREDCQENLPDFDSIQFMNSLIIVTKRGAVCR